MKGDEVNTFSKIEKLLQGYSSGLIVSSSPKQASSNLNSYSFYMSSPQKEIPSIEIIASKLLLFSYESDIL